MEASGDDAFVDEDGTGDPEECEVQLYHFDVSAGSWTDQGCGVVHIVNDTGQAGMLTIKNESGLLLNEIIEAASAYRIEGGSGITFWSKADNIEKAMSFDAPEQCQRISEEIETAKHMLCPCNLPETIEREKLGEILESISTDCSQQVLGLWACRCKIIDRLLSLFHGVCLSDPKLRYSETHEITNQIWDLTNRILRSADDKLFQHITADVKVWWQYLLLVDYHDWYDYTSPETSKGSEVSYPSTPDLELLSRFVVPWDRTDIPCNHTNCFREGGLRKLKQLIPLNDSILESKIHQTARVMHWVNSIIIPASVSSAPIPSVVPFSVAGGGDWEAAIIRLQTHLQENQLYIVSTITHNSSFLEDFFREMQERKDVSHYIFLSELFKFASATYHVGVAGCDLCLELAPHGLFPALIEGLNLGEEISLQCARLLEACTGASPKPCTDGIALKSYMMLSERSTKELMTRFADITFSDDPSVSDVSECLFEILSKLLLGNFSKKSVHPSSSSDLEHPLGVQGHMDQILNSLDKKVVDEVIKHVVPQWMQRIASVGSETCYRTLALLGHIMEEDGVEITDAEKAWRGHLKELLVCYFVRSGDLRTNGVFAGLLDKYSTNAVIVAAIVRLHRCLIQSNCGDIVGYYEVSCAASPVIKLFSQSEKRDTLVTSAVLNLLEVIRINQKLLVSVYHMHLELFTDKELGKRIPALCDFLKSVPDEDVDSDQLTEPGSPASPFGQVTSEYNTEDNEMSKAYAALATVEELRFQLLCHYTAICNSSRIAPSPPSFEIPTKPSVLSPAAYSEVFSKVKILNEYVPARVATRRGSIECSPTATEPPVRIPGYAPVRGRNKSFRKSSSKLGFKCDEESMYSPHPPRRSSNNKSRA